MTTKKTMPILKIISILLCMCFICGCSAMSSDTLNFDIEVPTNCIGVSQEEACKTLNIEQSKMSGDWSTGLWCEEKIRIHEKLFDFQLSLAGPNMDIITGCRYIYKFDKENEPATEAKALMEEIIKDMDGRYGSPDTYNGIVNSFSKAKEDFPQYQKTIYEIWDVEMKGIDEAPYVICVVQIEENDKGIITLTIQYKVQTMPAGGV